MDFQILFNGFSFSITAKVTFFTLKLQSKNIHYTNFNLI